MRVRKDNFEAVRKNIQDMVAKLKAQGEEEIKQKDMCIDQFNKNGAATDQATKEKDKMTAKVDDLTTTVKDLDTAIQTLKTEVADMKDQMKRAGEDREIANKDFQ